MGELGTIFMRFITGDVQCSCSFDIVGFFASLNINGAVTLFHGVYLGTSDDRGCQCIFDFGQQIFLGMKVKLFRIFFIFKPDNIPCSTLF